MKVGNKLAALLFILLLGATSCATVTGPQMMVEGEQEAILLAGTSFPNPVIHDDGEESD